MFVVAGLGNPGREYESTRHNVGFMFLDSLATEARSSVSQAKFHSHCGRINWQGHDLFLLKPQTFMNVSGGPVLEALTFFKVPPEKLIVVFDDLDLAPGAVRARFGGGHGGHNGVRDILARLGQDKFHRLKIGIGKPVHASAGASWVLSKFGAEEQRVLEEESFPVVRQRLADILKAGLKART